MTHVTPRAGGCRCQACLRVERHRMRRDRAALAVLAVILGLIVATIVRSLV